MNVAAREGCVASAPAELLFGDLLIGHVDQKAVEVRNPSAHAVRVALWARVLKGAPGSRFLMKNFGLGDPETRARFARLFAEAGIGEESGARGCRPIQFGIPVLP